LAVIFRSGDLAALPTPRRRLAKHKRRLKSLPVIPMTPQSTTACWMSDRLAATFCITQMMCPYIGQNPTAVVTVALPPQRDPEIDPQSSRSLDFNLMFPGRTS